MTPRPAALYLTHFDLEPTSHALVEGFGAQALDSLWPPEQEEDALTLRLAEAHEAGRAEGAEAARQQAEAELERIRQEGQASLALERQKWLEEEGAALKERLATALQRIEDELAECVARILRPFIIESLRRQMVAELVKHVGGLVASHEMIAIKIAGPADLLATLQGKLGALPIAVAYEESDGVDVRIAAEQTMIETRLQAWIDLISARRE